MVRALFCLVPDTSAKIEAFLIEVMRHTNVVLNVECHSIKRCVFVVHLLSFVSGYSQLYILCDDSVSVWMAFVVGLFLVNCVSIFSNFLYFTLLLLTF